MMTVDIALVAVELPKEIKKNSWKIKLNGIDETCNAQAHMIYFPHTQWKNIWLWPVRADNNNDD